MQRRRRQEHWRRGRVGREGRKEGWVGCVRWVGGEEEPDKGEADGGDAEEEKAGALGRRERGREGGREGGKHVKFLRFVRRSSGQRH